MFMKRAAAILLLLCLLLPAACKNDAPAAPDQPAANRIISIGPPVTEIIVALERGGDIVAVDTYSSDIAGLPADLPTLDMMALDGELILSLQPTVVFTTTMTQVEGEDPLTLVSNAGVRVVYIANSESIEAIKGDIRSLAAELNAGQTGETLVAGMEAELKRIGDIGASIADKKSVYFEISAAPYMYSFGRGVFLNEMIELIGARNIFADQVSWMPVGDEAVPAANPDCVLTNVDYMDDPIGEIMSRSGWDAITAVKNSAVYQIDANASSRASHHIIKALNEMAKAVYPELYK